MDFKDTWDGQNLILSRRGKAAEGVGLEALSLTFVIMRACFAKTVAHVDRKSTRLNSSHSGESRMPSSA